MATLADSDLVKLSFALRDEGVDAGTATGLVGWAVQEFAMGRCAYLAAAVCRAASREHFVAFVHPDGRMAHAVVALSPQHGLPLAGNGADILGKRPLGQIEREVRSLCGPVRTEIGSPPDDLGPDEEKALVAFAAGLPWFRGLTGRGGELLSAARSLGFGDGNGPG